MHHVLWVYPTTPRRSIREMPFSMTYGSEAIIPLKVGFLMMKTDQFDSRKNYQLICAILDLAEEKRELATVKLAHYQQKLSQGYDKNARSRTFLPGDLVLRKVIRNTRNPLGESSDLIGRNPTVLRQ